MARSRRSRWGRIVVALGVVAALLGPADRAGGAAAPPRDTARFACPADAPNPFVDLAGSVHEAAIRCMTRYGFVNGTSSTTFEPSAPVTRAQLASLLARGLAYTGVALDTRDHGFTDLGTTPHRGAIDALANLGVIAGTSPTTFQPGLPVTRGQAASMVARLLQLGTALPAGPDAFVDDEGSVHEASIDALAAAGILGGVTSDRYEPASPITRAASASILARVQDFAVEHRISPPVAGDGLVLAALRGSEVVPGPGDAALGSIELARTGVTGLLCARWTMSTALSSAPTAAHVHRGGAGSAGPVVLTLPLPDGAAGSDHTACAPGLDQAAIDALFADPGAHHVDVHSGSHPDGAMRGQLGAFATPLGTLLSPAEVAPGPGEAGAQADATLEVLDDGTTLCSAVYHSGASAPMAAHVHRGAPGEAGPVAIALPRMTAEGASRGCVGDLDPALLQELATDPAGFYVDVHTVGSPDGAVRGQLDRSALLATSLSGGAAVPTGDPDGAGEAYLDLLGDGLMCLRVTVRSTGTPTVAHVHAGAPGAAGPIVATLPTPAFNTSGGCVMIDGAAFAALVDRPGDHYVDVHDAAHPDGAVRGQLASQL